MASQMEGYFYLTVAYEWSNPNGSSRLLLCLVHWETVRISHKPLR